MSVDQKNAVRAKLLFNRNHGETGVWQILGEDPNCDLGGSHHQPTLATVQGTYESAVEFALDLPRFFTWGGGGNIEKVEIVQVNQATLQQRMLLNSKSQRLKEELAEIEKELAEIEKELKALGQP